MGELTHRTVRTNGIDMHIAEQGAGPLVVMCHGFPELWYSWRHQLPALADTGFHAVAPDQRGFGDTTRPAAVADYDLVHLTDDMLGLLDALGEETAVFVGHDWGAPVVWTLAARAPERVRGVVGMSVAASPRAPERPTSLWKQVFTGTWFYILYFQEPGVADAELGADATTFLRRFLFTLSGDAGGDALAGLAGPRDGRGMLDRLEEPPAGALPNWLTDTDLATFAAAFEQSGFTGGLNWYRNFDRNWELSATWADRRIDMPALFISGDRDPVLNMVRPEAMEGMVTDLCGTVLIPGIGHWTQQESPAEVNAALLGFLESLPSVTGARA